MSQIKLFENYTRSEEGQKERGGIWFWRCFMLILISGFSEENANMNQMFSAGVLMHPNVDRKLQIWWKGLFINLCLSSLKLNGVFEQIFDYFSIFNFQHLTAFILISAPKHAYIYCKVIEKFLFFFNCIIKWGDFSLICKSAERIF